jgi:hypothetical protein
VYFAVAGEKIIPSVFFLRLDGGSDVGIKKNEGLVITRNRQFVRNLWPLPDTTGPAWYLLQTNYDHWLPDPVHDARRTYGDRFMDGLGQESGASLDGVYTVLSTWRKLLLCVGVCMYVCMYVRMSVCVTHGFYAL